MQGAEAAPDAADAPFPSRGSRFDLRQVVREAEETSAGAKAPRKYSGSARMAEAMSWLNQTPAKPDPSETTLLSKPDFQNQFYSTAASNSSRVTVAVPLFITTIPPA